MYFVNRKAPMSLPPQLFSQPHMTRQVKRNIAPRQVETSGITYIRILSVSGTLSSIPRHLERLTPLRRRVWGGVVLYYCISGVVLRIFMEKVSPTCHKKTPPTIRGQGRMYRVIKITVSLSFFRERLDLGIWNEELVRNIKSQVSQEDIKTSGDCFSFWGGAPFLTNFK